MVESVASGAAKLTKFTCSKANTLNPVSPAGRSAGAIFATIQSMIPAASSSRMIDSITTMMGNRTNRASSTADLPAVMMMLMMSKAISGRCSSARVSKGLG